MPTIEGLQAVQNLQDSQQKASNDQQTNARRQAVVPIAAEKFKAGDIKGAYMELAAADPEWALKMLGGNSINGPKIVKSMAIQDPETGQINEHALYSDGTVQPLGVKGFAPQGYFNPTTGEREMSYGGTGDRRSVTGANAGRFINQGSTNPNNKPIQPGARPAPGVQVSPAVPGAAAPTLSAPKQPLVDPEEKEIKRAFQSLDPKMRGYYQKEQDAFMAEVKDDREAVEASKRTVSMLQAGKELNGDILRVFQNQFARASGERGVMTEQDVAPFGGRQGVLERLERFARYKTVGQIPAGDRKFLSDIAGIMAKNNATAINNKSEAYVNQIAAQTNLTAAQARKLMLKGVVNSDASKAAAPAAQGEMVRVIGPNGKAGMIPKANLQKALDSKKYKLAE